MAAPLPRRAAAAGVPSPCVNICRMHAATGWCEGCLRTLDEIAAWGGAGDAERQAVLARLPERRRQWRALRQVALPAQTEACVATPATTPAAEPVTTPGAAPSAGPIAGASAGACAGPCADPSAA